MVAQSPSESNQRFRIEYSTETARCFTEPLEGLGEALPLEMILIPSGRFMMGSPETEPDRQDDEKLHQVTVSAFFMGRYPITQAQWRVVAALDSIGRELELNPSNFEGDNCPLEQVSWYEAMGFCQRLSKLTGREYSLPSEAQWEYACRAGTTTPFHFGETIHPELANYYSESSYNNSPTAKSEGKTTPVNQFDVANAWGLCDMHGNVDEWCLDHYGSYDDAPTDGSARITEDNSASRILRGGSWLLIPGYCRSAFRYVNSPVNRNYDIGFRVMCRAPRALQ